MEYVLKITAYYVYLMCFVNVKSVLHVCRYEIRKCYNLAYFILGLKRQYHMLKVRHVVKKKNLQRIYNHLKCIDLYVLILYE